MSTEQSSSFPVSKKFLSKRFHEGFTKSPINTRHSTPICDYILASSRDERGWYEVICLDSPFLDKVYYSEDKMDRYLVEIVNVSGHDDGLLICGGRIYTFM